MAGSGPDNRDFHGHMEIRVLSSTVVWPVWPLPSADGLTAYLVSPNDLTRHQVLPPSTDHAMIKSRS